MKKKVFFGLWHSLLMDQGKDQHKHPTVPSGGDSRVPCHSPSAYLLFLFRFLWKLYLDTFFGPFLGKHFYDTFLWTIFADTFCGHFLWTLLWNIYMGGISQDIKRLKIWDFYPLFFGFSWPFTFLFL